MSCSPPASSGLVFQAVAHLKTKKNLAGFFDAMEVGSGWGMGGVVRSGWGIDETLVNLYLQWVWHVCSSDVICVLSVLQDVVAWADSTESTLYVSLTSIVTCD